MHLLFYFFLAVILWLYFAFNHHCRQYWYLHQHKQYMKYPLLVWKRLLGLHCYYHRHFLCVFVHFYDMVIPAFTTWGASVYFTRNINIWLCRMNSVCTRNKIFQIPRMKTMTQVTGPHFIMPVSMGFMTQKRMTIFSSLFQSIQVKKVPF